MIGFGTLFNVLCIVFGGLFGLFCQKLLGKNLQKSLMGITGIAVIFFGIAGTLENMLEINGNALKSKDTVMTVISLALGTVIGELLKLEAKINTFGQWLQNKSRSGGDSQFVKAFVTSSCTVSIGAMAIIGSIQDGISGDYSVLLIKGILDAIIIAIMTASQGKGCIFSALPVAALQGTVTLLAFFAGDFLPASSVSNLSLVGSILIFCVGLNLIRSPEQYLPVANFLPAVLIAVIWGFF